MSSNPDQIPYAAIRLFSEAVHLGSLSAAAQASGISPSAVSHRIVSLEAWIGAPVLDRSVRRPRPTALGQVLLDGVGSAFDRLDRISSAVRRASEPDRVVVSAPPAIAALRLFPLVSGFGDDTKVELRLSDFNAPIEDDPVDLAIRFLHDGPSDQRLGVPGWSAVCSKSQWERAGRPRHVRDLQNVPFLHEAIFNFWPQVYQECHDVLPRQYVPFGDALSVFSAVSSGHGAALLPTEVARLAVANGNLVVLGGGNVEPEAAFYIARTAVGKTRDAAADVQQRFIEDFG